MDFLKNLQKFVNILLILIFAFDLGLEIFKIIIMFDSLNDGTNWQITKINSKKTLWKLNNDSDNGDLLF